MEMIKNQSETLEAEGCVSYLCRACLMSQVIAAVEAFGLQRLTTVEELRIINIYNMKLIIIMYLKRQP